MLHTKKGHIFLFTSSPSSSYFILPFSIPPCFPSLYFPYPLFSIWSYWASNSPLNSLRFPCLPLLCSSPFFTLSFLLTPSSPPLFYFIASFPSISTCFGPPFSPLYYTYSLSLWPGTHKLSGPVERKQNFSAASNCHLVQKAPALRI